MGFLIKLLASGTCRVLYCGFEFINIHLYDHIEFHNQTSQAFNHIASHKYNKSSNDFYNQ